MNIFSPPEDMDVLHHHCYHGDESSNMPEESYAQVSNSKASQVTVQLTPKTFDLVALFLVIDLFEK